MTPGGPCWSFGSFGTLGSIFSSSPVSVVSAMAMVIESLVRLLGPSASGCVVRGAWYCRRWTYRVLHHSPLSPWTSLIPCSGTTFCFVLLPSFGCRTCWSQSPSQSQNHTPGDTCCMCSGCIAALAALLLLLLGIALLGVSTAGHIMTFRFVVTLALHTRPLALAIFQSHCQRLSPPWCFVRAKLTITASPPAWSCSLSQR